MSKMFGSSIVGVILYLSSLLAIFLVVPLRIFPDLVFGRLFTNATILKDVNGPTVFETTQNVRARDSDRRARRGATRRTLVSAGKANVVSRGVSRSVKRKE